VDVEQRRDEQEQPRLFSHVAQILGRLRNSVRHALFSGHESVVLVELISL
jgi:hypothetical protein